MSHQNIYQLFRAQTAKYRGKPVFYSRDHYDNWQSQNWEEFEEQVHDFACALLAKNLTRGASVAILAGNVAEWTIVDVATIAAGGVGVGIYPTSSPEQCEYIINHSDAEFVFVDTKHQLEKIWQSRAELPRVREIICLEENDSATNFKDFLQFGRQNRENFLSQIEEIGSNVKPEDIAIMVYTSGTTGNPKGAMLSHQYILNSVESLRQTIPIYDTDVSLSYLPGCHVAERISGIYNRLYNGAAAYFVDDLSKLYAYMLEVKPTVFASLPRFFEKIYAKVVSEVESFPVREREEFEKSLNVGRGIIRLQTAKEKISVDLKERFSDVLPNLQLLKNAFGGNIRLATSGGAPLPEEIAEFFAACDLPILQAYGLTENICVAFNRADDFKFGTVGKPMPMCDVKIAEDGEILVKSPMMFSGYYKEPEKTAAMFDENGWLKTGDLGSLDADGFLKITGRKKEIIVLSNGKNVAPALVENFVKENHLVSQCFVSGDGKSYCVALITLNQTEVMVFAKANKIEFTNFTDLIKNNRVCASIEETIAKANAKVSSSEQIKKFMILERDFSAEADEITPTMKLKRNVISERFKNLISNLYK
jgi:long-chain acyl-CoA synthetase